MKMTFDATRLPIRLTENNDQVQIYSDSFFNYAGEKRLLNILFQGTLLALVTMQHEVIKIPGSKTPRSRCSIEVSNVGL
jgi:hypothetical protein